VSSFTFLIPACFGGVIGGTGWRLGTINGAAGGFGETETGSVLETL